MMQPFKYLSFLLFFSAITTKAQDSTTSDVSSASDVPTASDEITASPVNNAAVPTRPGQIGINPVLDEIGDPNDYAATVGDSDSAFFVQEAGQYDYIATADDELAVTTANGATSTIRVAATTATADADGVSVGDIAVVLPAAAALSLKDAVFSSVQACGGVSAKVRRDLRTLSRRQDAATACMIRAAHDAAQNDAVWGGIEAANWEELGIPLFEGVEELWLAVLQVGINVAIRNRMTLFLAAGTIVGGEILNLGIDAAREAVNLRKMQIPKEGAGRPAEEDEEQQEQCDPNAEPNQDSPQCSGPDCLGIEGRCTVGTSTGCRCTTSGKALYQWGSDTRDWFETERVQVLNEIASGTGSTDGSGSNITVNTGCIVIDDSPRCAGGDPYNVAETGSDTLSATIYGKFLGDASERSENPGCKLEATWASNIQKLNYGEDDCLYDGNTQLACCSERPPETVPNPYFQGEGSSTPDTAKPALISPSRTDGSIDCLDKTDGGGTQTGRTFWTADTTFVFGERITNEMTISTADRSKCLASGDTIDEQGRKLSTYCVVSCQNQACFVIADKNPDFGGTFPGSSSITGSDLLTYAANSARQCPGDNKVTVGAGPGVEFSVALCIVGQDHPEICTTP